MVLLDPKIYLAKSDDEESSLKECEWWLGDFQENVSFVFKAGRGFEGRMIFEGFEDFLLVIAWEDKSKALLGPENFFNDLDDPDFGVGSSFRWFPNLEVEEWKSGRWISTLES